VGSCPGSRLHGIVESSILHLFEAPSAEALDRAGRLAGLRFDRIVEAVETARGDGGAT